MSDAEELAAWKSRFADLGVVHSDIKESPFGGLIVLRDPDNIHVEVFAPRSPTERSAQ